MNETFALGFLMPPKAPGNLLFLYPVWIPPAIFPLLLLSLYIPMFKILVFTTVNLCKILLPLIYRNENQQPHSCGCLREITFVIHVYEYEMKLCFSLDTNAALASV